MADLGCPFESQFPRPKGVRGSAAVTVQDQWQMVFPSDSVLRHFRTTRLMTAE